MEESKCEKQKGKVCVTGGTGFVASWLIMRLLQHGYSVNTTVRPQRSGVKKDISFLTKLDDAGDRLQIFNADFENPDSFEAAIEGCVGVFHVAHPIEFNETESDERVTQKCVEATLGILRSCVKSKTVKRVVYTSSMSTVMVKEQEKLPADVVDEDVWSDVDYVRSLKIIESTYCISKTMTERAALEFAQKHSLDVVTVVPSWIHGPFICPNLPGSVHSSLALLIGNEKQIKYPETTPFVHTDDVARAHIFLFEYPEAKGRYLCSAVEIKYDDLCEFIRNRYSHQFQVLSDTESLCHRTLPFRTISSKKLLDTGFSYKYGLEEMYDDAIQCCRQKGFL